MGSLIAMKGEKEEVIEWYIHIFKRKPEVVEKVTERIWLLGYVLFSLEIRRLTESAEEAEENE